MRHLREGVLGPLQYWPSCRTAVWWWWTMLCPVFVYIVWWWNTCRRKIDHAKGCFGNHLNVSARAAYIVAWSSVHGCSCKRGSSRDGSPDERAAVYYFFPLTGSAWIDAVTRHWPSNAEQSTLTTWSVLHGLTGLYAQHTFSSTLPRSSICPACKAENCRA